MLYYNYNKVVKAGKLKRLQKNSTICN